MSIRTSVLTGLILALLLAWSQQLVAAHALEGSSASEISVSTLNPDWEALLRELNATTAELCRIFLR